MQAILSQRVELWNTFITICAAACPRNGDYYEVITKLYKDIPILAITPLWRGDNMEGVPTLIKFCDNLKAILKKHDVVTMVEGWKMVPHLEEYYLDNLHPNQLGTEVYARNLVREIERLGF